MSELNIPESWAETSLEKLCILIADIDHKMPKAVSEGYAFLSAKDVSPNGELLFKNIKYISKQDFENYSRKCKPTFNDIIYTRIGTIGRAAIVKVNTDFLVSYSCCTIRPLHSYINVIFLRYYLTSVNCLSQAHSGAKGIGVPDLGMTTIKNFKTPLPSLQEQNRIVQKIESLFAKIDATEANLSNVETLLVKYRESLLAKAFRGELVPQDPNDEPASVLLEKIRKERSQNAKGKKAEQEFTPISDEDKPFELPMGWEWVRFGEISNEQLIGLVRSSELQSDSYTYPYIKMGDIDSKGNLLQSQLTNVECTEEELQKYRVKEGDFLFNTRNSQKLVGKSCSIEKLSNPNTVFNNNIMRVRFVAGISSKFISHMFRTAEIQQQLRNRNQGTTNVSAIYAKDLNTVILPLPHENSQLMISKLLDEKFHTIDLIQQKIIRKRAVLIKMRESILQLSFEGRLVEQIPSEGTGHELLAKILAEKEAAQNSKLNEKSKKTIKKAPANKAVATKGK